MPDPALLSWTNRAKAVVKAYQQEQISLEKAVIYHLKAVIFPPMDEKQYPSTIRAVRFATAGDYNHPVHVPVTVEGNDHPTAQDIVIRCGLDFLVTAAQYKEPYGINYQRPDKGSPPELPMHPPPLP